MRPSLAACLPGAHLACMLALLGCAPDLELSHRSDGAASASSGGQDGSGREGGQYLDSKRFGDAADQTAAGLALGGDGSVTFAGSFAGSFDLGDGPLASAGNDDIFVARSDAQGKLAFSARFGDASGQTCRAIAVDASDNTFVVGDFIGSIDVGMAPQPSVGGQDSFILKLDPTGGRVAFRTFGGGGYQTATSVAVDASGNAVVAGFFSGAATFAGASLTSAGGYDVFATKLDANGELIWNKRFGDKADQRAFGVAADAAGNTFLVGAFGGSVEFVDGAPLESAGEANVFVAKLGPDGGTLWSRCFGDATTAAASSVAVDRDGGVIVAGSFAGSLDLGGGALKRAQDGGLFVAKLDAGGGYVWSRGFGKTGAASVRGLATDWDGSVLFTGEFAGSMAFGATTLASAGAEDGFVARLDARGKVLWSERFGDTAAQRGTAVAASADGDVWVAGGFAGSVDFGGGALMSAGGKDLFLARLTR